MDQTNSSDSTTQQVQPQQNAVPAHLDISKPFSDEANLAVLVNALENAPAYEETFQFRDDMDEERARRYMDWEVQELSQKVGGKYDIGYVIEKQSKGLKVLFHVRSMGPEHHVPPPPPAAKALHAQDEKSSGDEMIPLETKQEPAEPTMQPSDTNSKTEVSEQGAVQLPPKTEGVATTNDEGQLQDVSYGSHYDMNGKPIVPTETQEIKSSTNIQPDASSGNAYDITKPLSADENIAVILNLLDTTKVFEQEILCGLNILTNEETQKVIASDLDQLYQKLSEKRANIKSYTKVATTIVGEDESTQKMRVRVKIEIDPTTFQEFMARTELENITNQNTLSDQPQT